jgi:hypothetical protein
MLDAKYPSATAVRKYIHAYAQHFGLLHLIRWVCTGMAGRHTKPMVTSWRLHGQQMSSTQAQLQSAPTGCSQP